MYVSNTALGLQIVQALVVHLTVRNVQSNPIDSSDVLIEVNILGLSAT